MPTAGRFVARSLALLLEALALFTTFLTILLNI